jgi:hypothetical protein
MTCNCRRILIKSFGYYPTSSFSGGPSGDYDEYNCQDIFVKLTQGYITIGSDRKNKLSPHSEYNFKINYCPICGKKL